MNDATLYVAQPLSHVTLTFLRSLIAVTTPHSPRWSAEHPVPRSRVRSSITGRSSSLLGVSLIVNHLVGDHDRRAPEVTPEVHLAVVVHAFLHDLVRVDRFGDGLSHSSAST